MSAENTVLVRRWFEKLWNRRHLETVDDLADPNMVAHGMGQHGADLGREEFKAFARTLLESFPDMHVTVEDMLAQDDRVAVRFSVAMTHTQEFLGIPATGRHAKVHGMTMVRIANGKIVEGWNDWDQLGLLTQLGVITPMELVPNNDKHAKAS